jgi:hypothetical protein
MPPQRKLIRFAKEKLLRAYVREAAHLRAVAENVMSGPIKARLFEEADRQERLAEEVRRDGPNPPPRLGNTGCHLTEHSACASLACPTINPARHYAPIMKGVSTNDCFSLGTVNESSPLSPS